MFWWLPNLCPTESLEPWERASTWHRTVPLRHRTVRPSDDGRCGMRPRSLTEPWVLLTRRERSSNTGLLGQRKGWDPLFCERSVRSTDTCHDTRPHKRSGEGTVKVPRSLGGGETREGGQFGPWVLEGDCREGKEETEGKGYQIILNRF